LSSTTLLLRAPSLTASSRCTGTGKSVLLRELIKSLRDKYPDPGAVCVTASTGIAAVSIGGSTVHSFAGIGLGLEDVHRLAGKIRGRKEVLRRWRDAKVWIIDERQSPACVLLALNHMLTCFDGRAVSMLDGRLFDKLAALGSTLRGDKRPFGGIQVRSCACPPPHDLRLTSRLPPLHVRWSYAATSCRSAFFASVNGVALPLTRLSAAAAARYAGLGTCLRVRGEGLEQHDHALHQPDPGVRRQSLSPSRFQTDRALSARLPLPAFDRKTSASSTC
jgi:hypothetical protein